MGLIWNNVAVMGQAGREGGSPVIDNTLTRGSGNNY